MSLGNNLYLGMKKPILLLLLFFAITYNIQAQSPISQDQFSEVIIHLNNEDWEGADPLIRSSLDKIPADNIDDGQAAVLRYMYIITQAGLVNLKKLSKNDALKKVKDFEGHTVQLPWNKISMKQGLNKLSLVNDRTDTLFVTHTNKKGTEIFAFVYITPENKPDLTEFKQMEGRPCRFFGKLTSINVEGSMLPRFKMFISEAELEIKPE
jgi:hypothetical protein